MVKYLYVSTQEGHYFHSVIKTVDRGFRVLLRAAKAKKIPSQDFYNVLHIWEDFLDEYMLFIASIPEHYETEYTKKVAQKKREISLKEIRLTGEKITLDLRSRLNDRLFKAGIATEMCFKILEEHTHSYDVPVEAYLDFSEQFDVQKEKIEEAINRLRKLCEIINGHVDF